MVLPERVRRGAEPFRCRDERTHMRHPRPCARCVADIGRPLVLRGRRLVQGGVTGHNKGHIIICRGRCGDVTGDSRICLGPAQAQLQIQQLHLLPCTSNGRISAPKRPVGSRKKLKSCAEGVVRRMWRRCTCGGVGQVPPAHFHPLPAVAQRR